MDSGESSERQPGNARDAWGRRPIVLGVDLNIAPRRELMDLNEHRDVVEGEGSGNSRGQAVLDGAVAGDDDVEIISPSTFEEVSVITNAFEIFHFGKLFRLIFCPFSLCVRFRSFKATRNSTRVRNHAATEVTYEEGVKLNSSFRVYCRCFNFFSLLISIVYIQDV